jgi:4-amino-4-deoxy-L-arabinose transferase-like glycosyltransferase
MTTNNQSHHINATALSSPLPWLTIDITLWGLLLVITLGLRLFRLDAALLNAAEARGALAAWRFAHGLDQLGTPPYSPLVFSAQWFAFLVFGADAITARLLPALAGAALTLTPALLRRRIGRLGALAAGTLLALSPTALTLSRTASGDILVALGSMLCASGLWRFVDHQTAHKETAIDGVTDIPTDVPWTFWLIPLGLALTLVASSLAYSALLAMAIGLMILLLVEIDPQARHQLRTAWQAFSNRTLPNLVYYAAGVLAGAFVLLSTAFFWHPQGLGAAARLLTDWLGGFVRWPDSLSAGYPWLILITYEPLILLTGLLGIKRGINHGNAAIRFLASWSVAALVLAWIRPGRGPGDVLLVIAPLACLGGLALDTLIQDLRRWGQWLNEGLYLAVSLPLWVYLLLNLATYTSRPGQYTQLPLSNAALPTYLGLALSTLLLLLMLALGIGLLQGFGPALRSLALSTMLALVFFTLSTAWGVSQNRPADPREPLLTIPTDHQIRQLNQTLTTLANKHRGDAHAIEIEIDITLLSDEPVLAWALRDFQTHYAPASTFALEGTEKPIATSAIITPYTSTNPPQLGEAYVGQSFLLRQRWDTQNLACQWHIAQFEFDQVRQLDCSALAQWLIFRHSPQRPAEERIVLWLRKDLIQ